MHIEEGGLNDPRVVALLETHRSRALAETARGSGHALDLSALSDDGVTFWSGWADDTRATLVAIGALTTLAPDHGEVKSMHVAEAQRGRGHGAEMLRHIIAAARAQGMTRLSL